MINLNNFNTFNFVNQKAFIFLLTTIIYCEISFVSGFSSTKQSNVGINLGTKYSFQISPSSVRPFQLIGNGTFGTVYRSKLLQSTVQGNERDVITKVSHQHVSNASIEYLETESYINQKLCTHQNQLQHHVNIAPFLGECFQDVEEKLQRTLVWEVAGNETLEDILSLNSFNASNPSNEISIEERLENCLAIEKVAISEKSDHNSHIDAIGNIYWFHYIARIVLHQILEGLSYCHSKGIVHRDIKPANLLVDEHSSSIRLIDFGSAADMSNWMNRRGLNNNIRSVLYCAPEEFVDKEYAYAFDIYSAAITWLRVIIPGLQESDEKFFEFRRQVRDCRHDLKVWYHIAKKENTLPIGWDYFFDTTEEGRDAFHLLLRLMAYEPKLRPSASEALLEPYLNPGCIEFLRPIPPTLSPWNWKSHLERWQLENSDLKKQEECEIPEWYLDNLLNLSLY